MQMLRRVFLIGPLALLLAACGGGTSTGSSSSYAGKTINLGAVISLSGAGGVYGPQQKNGIDLAVEMLNKNGINGAKISVGVEDDRSDKQQSALAVQTLIQTRKVFGVIGPTLSNSAVASHPVAQNLHAPILAPSSTGKHIVGDCPYPGGCNYIFRDSLGEATAIPGNVKAAVTTSHAKSAVLLFANDDKSSADGADIFKQAFTDNGVSIPDANVLQFPKTESDFKSYVTTARSKSADLWAISGLGAIPAKIMIEARAQGYTGPFLGGNGLNAYPVSQQAGERGKGAQSGSAYFVGFDDAANKSFVDAYKARYKDGQGNPQLPDQIAAQAYTAVLIFAEAARNANLGFTDIVKDRDRLRSALEKVNIASPLGQFRFTSQHDVHQTLWINAFDGKGSYVNVTSFQSN